MADRDSPRVTRDQRDAIREWLVWDLQSTADGFGMHLTEREDFEGARESWQELEDGVGLLDDIGWSAEDPRDSFALTMPADRLDRLLDRFKEYSKITLFGHAMGFLKNLDEEEEFKRAVLIGRAYVEIHLARKEDQR